MLIKVNEILKGGPKMKRIGDGAVRILYSVLFCLVSLGLTWVPSPQITMAQAKSSFDTIGMRWTARDSTVW